MTGAFCVHGPPDYLVLMNTSQHDPGGRVGGEAGGGEAEQGEEGGTGAGEEEEMRGVQQGEGGKGAGRGWGRWKRRWADGR